MKSIRARIDFVLKHNLIIQKAYKAVMGSIFRTAGVFLPLKKNMVLFNAHGRRYNDSPKAVFLMMITDPGLAKFEFVWALDEPEKYDIPRCRKVRMDTLRYFLTALRAKYWVSCVNIERGLRFKKKGQVYLNTWHGTPLKFVGNAVNGRKDFDFGNIDIFCCAGSFEKDIYIRDFNVSEKALLYSGLPRNDRLYRHCGSVDETSEAASKATAEASKIKAELGLQEGKRIILYAPTWRDSKNSGISYEIRPPVDFRFWEEKLGADYIVLMRAHAYTNKIMGVEFNDFIRDVSDYPDINDLMIISDMLISDYSAAIFDYSVLEKPILCFGYDYDEYRTERGLYIDLEKELPGGVIRTEQELTTRVTGMDYKAECEATKRFKVKYLEFGGDATRLCVEALKSGGKE